MELDKEEIFDFNFVIFAWKHNLWVHIHSM